MAFVEANKGRLLEIIGVTRLTNPAGNAALSLAGNANYLLNGLAGMLVRILAASTDPEDLIDVNLPTTEVFDVRSILSQYATSGTSGYQLLPHLATDLVLGGGRPRLTEESVQVNVSPSSFIVYTLP